MSDPVSEPSRTCWPVMNGVAAKGVFVPPMPPFATPANAAPSASMATTIAGEGRRNSNLLIVLWDISAPPFELFTDLVTNSSSRSADTDAHLGDQPPGRAQLAPPEADRKRAAPRLHVGVHDLSRRNRPAQGPAG